MNLPDFILALPEVDLPLPRDMVVGHAVKSDDALTVFFLIKKDTTLPPHSHKGQWGTVLAGRIELTMDGETRTYEPGESYNIPSGTVHGGFLPAGTVVMDVFEEADRYALRTPVEP